MTIEQCRIIGQLTVNLSEGIMQLIHPDTPEHEALVAACEVLAGNESIPIIGWHIDWQRIEDERLYEKGERP